MSLIFPASPSLDQVYQQDGAVYEWTGSKWRRMDTFQNSVVTEYADIVEYTANTTSIEPDKYNYFKITVDGNTTITLPPASAYSNIVIELALGTTAYTVTWSNNVEWAGGSAPSYNYGYAAKVLLEFTTYDGTNWIGSELLDYTIPVIVPTGEQAYTNPGTYTWVAPEGVTTVYVVAIGGGGGGAGTLGWVGINPSGGGGGGGGGLGYKNNISVIPGTAYTVYVGNGGDGTGGSGNSITRATSGEDSYFINTSTVKGGGGQGGVGGNSNSYTDHGSGGGTGGSYTGDGGGNGGRGGSGLRSGRLAGGGGGAGGYSGDGGAGEGAQGFGGGAGGGARSGGAPAYSGGGVNPYGAGSSGTSSSAGGKGGSGGTDGLQGTGSTTTVRGGVYGGGGAGNATSSTENLSGNKGAPGAVRIIWGSDRAFPSTNTGVL